jgi:hypothetical protein
MHDAASQRPSALSAQGAAVHPCPGPGGQLDIHVTWVVAGQRLGCMAQERDLVPRAEGVPRVVVHQHHVVG